MPRIVLRGRVVTMAGPVIDDGCLYIDGNRIEAVQPAGQAAPAGYANAVRIEPAEADLFPGLMDLHNHPPYNVMPLWKTPQRFDGRSQWLKHADYKRCVRGPADLLKAKGPQVHKAIARYVEVKALLGGTTTLQGLSGSSANYVGLTRNLEATAGAGRPAINTQVGDLSASELPDFRHRMGQDRPMFLHLAEGLDPKALGQARLVRDEDLLRPNLVCIHCVGLSADDHQALAAARSRVVWSPLSNFLLYGRSLEPGLLAAPFSLACDWTPSGSRNLLLELKVAWLWDQQQAPQTQLGAERLAHAVTADAARVCQWAGLGRLESGMLADCLVLRRRDTDPYLSLVKATERDLRLVMVDGQAHCGDLDLMRQLAPPAELEAIKVGGEARALWLPASPSLADSRALLQAVLADLQAPAPPALKFVAADDTPFQLRFDMNEDDDGPTGAPWLNKEIEPLRSMPLDALTVVDDQAVLDAIAAVPHAPAFLRDHHLRDFYAA